MVKVGNFTTPSRGPYSRVIDLLWAKKIIAQYKVGKIGQAYLQSIRNSQNEHLYKGYWHLGRSLVMRDKVEKAAKEVQDKVGFELGHPNQKLDPAFWKRVKTKDDVYFVCKSTSYAAAVNAIFADMAKNTLECGNQSQLMALRALQLAMDDQKFDALLKRHLGKKKLQIPPNESLFETEELHWSAPQDSYQGAGVFRPGDVVAFANTRKVSDDPAVNQRHNPTPLGWGVENSICVGWKLDGKGNADFNEPLFSGGGPAPQNSTEAAMKEFLYKQAPWRNRDGTVSLFTPSQDALKKHYAEKALKLKGQDCSCSHGLRQLALRTSVKRLKLLGGRTNLPG